MKTIRLYLTLQGLLILSSCSTPGTTTGGSGLGSLMDAVLDIPMTILSIPADILGDPSTMGAIAQAASSYSDSSYSSSYDSGASYNASPSYSSSSSVSGGSSYHSSPSYTNFTSAETRYTGVNKRLIGGTANDDSSDSSGSAQDGVKAFEQSQMAKVEAYKRWVNGGSSSPSAGGTFVSTADDSTRHSKMVPSASEGEWAYVGEFEGVRVWWKYRRELKDQYESALKMENLNSYKVKISYKPWFIAADGTEYTESGGSFSMRAGQVLTGNSAGLFYHVTDAQKRFADGPRSGGVIDMLITPES